MERVAFLIEDTNERLGALLNPDSVVMRRAAGVRSRRSVSGQLTGTMLTDDPLLYTGGGRTELELQLLFDVSLAGSSIETDNVRDLTGPIWDLAENSSGDSGYSRPRLVRFVWGKTWNMLGVVTAVAERLEYFTAEGVPRRSWLHVRLLRVNEPKPEAPGERRASGLDLQLDSLPEPGSLDIPAGTLQTHEVICGGTDDQRGTGERLDEIASQYYGDPSLWRLIATFNAISDPMQVPCGSTLVIPPLPAFGGAA